MPEKQIAVLLMIDFYVAAGRRMDISTGTMSVPRKGCPNHTNPACILGRSPSGCPGSEATWYSAALFCSAKEGEGNSELTTAAMTITWRRGQENNGVHELHDEEIEMGVMAVMIGWRRRKPDVKGKENSI